VPASPQIHHLLSSPRATSMLSKAVIWHTRTPKRRPTCYRSVPVQTGLSTPGLCTNVANNYFLSRPDTHVAAVWPDDCRRWHAARVNLVYNPPTTPPLFQVGDWIIFTVYFLRFPEGLGDDFGHKRCMSFREGIELRGKQPKSLKNLDCINRGCGRSGAL